jgi:hypothetical protein
VTTAEGTTCEIARIITVTLTAVLWLGLSYSPCLGYGEIVAWGDDYYEQCTVPTPNTDFVSCDAGAQHSLGIKTDLSIVAWGDNARGQCNVPEPNTSFVDVSGGWNHSLGLRSDGSIDAWGGNGYGQCDVPQPNADFAAVAAGFSHSVGLKADGSIVAWGSNDYGEGESPDPNVDFVAVSTSNAHNLGLKSEGSVVAWGNGFYGQCDVPEPNANFVAVAAGGFFSLGLKVDGSIIAWGNNDYGQCDVPEPNTGFVAVAAGGGHGIGLKADGSIVCWGANGHGQSNLPEPNTGFGAISGGYAHSLGLKGRFIFGINVLGAPIKMGGAGEVASFSTEARNYGPFNDTYDISVVGVPTGWSYSYTTPEGTFSGPSSLQVVSGEFAPVTVDLDSQGNPGTATIQLRLVSQGDPSQIRRAFLTKLNGMEVLVIDDDGASGREVPVVETIAALGRTYAVYDVSWGTPTVDDLWDAAGSVVWLTGDTSLSLDEVERTLISDYLADGGNLLLSGQEIAYDLADPSSPYFSSETILWFINTLHSLYTNSSSAIYTLDGMVGDPLGDGLSFGIRGSGPYGQLTPDVIGQSSGVNFLHYHGMPTWFGGVHFTDGSQRLVYVSFGLEGIIEEEQRELLMSRVMDWFGVGAGIEHGAAPLARLSLAPIAPNPVTFPAVINYYLTNGSHVSLRIYDVSGRIVRTLVDGQQAAAEYHLQWNGSDDSGRPVVSGVYFYRLDTAGRTATQRLVVAR